jgi:hypothetical protein
MTMEDFGGGLFPSRRVCFEREEDVGCKEEKEEDWKEEVIKGKEGGLVTGRSWDGSSGRKRRCMYRGTVVSRAREVNYET